MKFQLKRKMEVRDWINIAAILIFIAILTWIGVLYTRNFGEASGGFSVSNLNASAEAVRDQIQGYGAWGLLILTGMQVLQVVISAIPAAVVQFVCGMIYNVPIAMATGIIGTAIGTAISFYLARLLGRRVVTLFFSEKTLKKVEGILAGNTTTIVLLVLFVLPSPKDLFSYALGLTNMKASKYFLISAVGRLPGMLITSFLGANLLQQQDYMLVAVVTAIVAVAGILVTVFSKRIVNLLNKKVPPKTAPDMQDASSAPEAQEISTDDRMTI